MDYASEWEFEEEERVGHGEGLNGEGRSGVVSRSWIWVGRALKSLLYRLFFFFPLSSPRFRGGRVKQRGPPAKALSMFFYFLFFLPPLEVKRRRRKINSDSGTGFD